MSKITLAPNAAGTGTLTIAAPNTSTDYTLTLPTATTTLVGTDATQTLTNKTIGGSQLTGTVAGSLLTGTVASSLLSGALPAIDGSALIGVSSMTLLGTLATTSGSSQTLSSLDLTTYKLVFFSWNNVSLTANASIALGGQTATDNLGATLTNVIVGWGTLVLNTGVFLSAGRASSAGVGSAVAAWWNGTTTITNASTSITIAASSGAFDAGSVTFYGVK
jgi:hypothetical protein